MPYDVTWSPEAEFDLARIWLTVTDRMSVKRASHRIEWFLQPTRVKGNFNPKDSIASVSRHWWHTSRSPNRSEWFG
jgi:hypothetical protein